MKKPPVLALKLNNFFAMQNLGLFFLTTGPPWVKYSPRGGDGIIFFSPPVEGRKKKK